MPKGTKSTIDHQTMRKIGERPDKEGKLYSPRRYLEYDVAANRWLKFFLLKLAHLCQTKLIYLQQVQNKIETDYKTQYRFSGKWHESERQFFEKNHRSSMHELVEVQNKIKKLCQYINVVLNDAFLRNVSLPSNTALPKTLMLNASYNLLYKVYRTLFRNKGRYTLNSQYQHYWKKTAQLYEIWTYIQVIKSLIDLDFEPVSGWIYDHSIHRKLPFLTDGTQVKFLSEDLVVNLTYNQIIPSYGKTATFNKPLTTVSIRNKPDIRLDVFNKNDKYLGSILLDAKYMKLNKIIRNVENKNRLKEQFTSYINDTSSPYFENQKYGVLRDVRPVAALLVLYPNNDLSENREEARHVVHNVEYIQTRPGMEKQDLDKSLSDNIEWIKDRALQLSSVISDWKL